MANVPHTIAPMSLAVARRILSDIDFAMQFDADTRETAWAVVHAARRGQSFSLVLIITDAPHTPGDAA